MRKFEKGYNLRLISLTIVFCFILNSNTYATVSLVDPYLRPPLQIEKKRIFEAQRMFLKDKLKRIPVGEKLIIGVSAMVLLSSVFPLIETFKESNLWEQKIYETVKESNLLRLKQKAKEIKFRNLKYQVVSPYADISYVNPGDINLLLSRHGSSENFVELIPVLDKIFEKARTDNKKIIWYAESGPSVTGKYSIYFFSDLSIEKLSDYHKEQVAYYERVLKEQVEIVPDGDFNLDSQTGFLLFMLRYMQGKSFDGYDLSVIPEQPSLDAYKLALEISRNKSDYQSEVALREMRDNDFADLIFSNHNKDAYIIVTRGMFHVDLADSLTYQGLNVNSYLSVKALEDSIEGLDLDNLKPFSSKSIRTSI